MFILIIENFVERGVKFGTGIIELPAEFEGFVAVWKAAGKAIDATAEQIAEFQNAQSGGNLSEREVIVTTGILANKQSETAFARLGKTFILTKVSASVACRVRLYKTAIAAQADLNRAVTVEAAAGIGLIGEFLFKSDLLEVPTKPLPKGETAETPPSSDCAVSVQNLSGETLPVIVTLVKITLEN